MAAIDLTLVNYDFPCEHCRSWGPTIAPHDAPVVPCPKCKRYTFPNLGINIPAGAAVAISGAHHFMSLLKQKDSPPSILEGIFEGDDFIKKEKALNIGK